MTWAKLDDRFPDNEKIASLSNSAFRLHVTALCYSAAQLTDGMLATGTLRRIGWASDNLDNDIAELVAARLWEQCEQGYVIHDYLEYNPSRSETIERQKHISEKRSKAGKTGMANRWQRDNKDDNKPITKEVTEREQSDNPVPGPGPVPVPVPEPVPGNVKPAATPPTSAPVKPRKSGDTKKTKPEPTPDPTLQNPAVIAYRGAMKLTPNQLQRQAIIETVGTDAARLERWNKTLDNWLLHGWKPSNVPGMLESFASNGNGHSATGRPQESNIEAAIRLSNERMARQAQGA